MRQFITQFPSAFVKKYAKELGVVESKGRLQIPVLVVARRILAPAN